MHQILICPAKRDSEIPNSEFIIPNFKKGSVHKMVTATELNYKNFGRCVKLDNGTASIIITVEVGPRIISYCLNGHENMPAQCS